MPVSNFQSSADNCLGLCRIQFFIFQVDGGENLRELGTGENFKRIISFFLVRI